jgi:hypothetical protein
MFCLLYAMERMIQELPAQLQGTARVRVRVMILDFPAHSYKEDGGLCHLYWKAWGLLEF